MAFKNLLKSIESTGIASVYGVNYFGKGILKQQNYISYIQHDSIAKDLLNSSLNYVAKLKREYKNLSQTMNNYGEIKKQYVFEIYHSLKSLIYSCRCRTSFFVRWHYQIDFLIISNLKLPMLLFLESRSFARSSKLLFLPNINQWGCFRILLEYFIIYGIAQ